MTIREIQNGIGAVPPKQDHRPAPIPVDEFLGRVNKKSVRLVPDRLANAGYLYLRPGVKRGESAFKHHDTKYETVYEFDCDGRLQGIDFLNLDNVDLMSLPHDGVIPGHAEIIEIFNSHGIEPRVEAWQDLSE